MPSPTLSDLRRYAIARSLFKPTTIGKAIAKLGFLQADPSQVGFFETNLAEDGPC